MTISLSDSSLLGLCQESPEVMSAFYQYKAAFAMGNDMALKSAHDGLTGALESAGVDAAHTAGLIDAATGMCTSTAGFGAGHSFIEMIGRCVENAAHGLGI